MRIIENFFLPEDIKLPNGTSISAGTRIGTGEDQILKHLSKAVKKRLLEAGSLAETDSNGAIIVRRKLDEQGREIFEDNFCSGLISPSRIKKAIAFLDEHKLCRSNLEVMDEKVKAVRDLGCPDPLLSLAADKIVSQLYDIVVLGDYSKT